ncbi:uncharacterized protein LOC142356056 isoform X2 [Convolutriloba macropyga]|uniref:uncharacterized protein LOC142356056 isoform X2 n=1 Tax=Convolutriloba macropyga TaxID=536237 RepID=UPI003F523DCC
MLRIETQGSLADLKKRSYFVRNATIEELLLSNLKPEVRTAVDPVCDTLVTRSFVLSQKESKNFADKLAPLVSGERGSKWVINVWQVQVVAMDFGIIRQLEKSESGDGDAVCFPQAWMDIITALSQHLRILDIVFDMAQLQISNAHQLDAGTGDLQMVFPILKMCSLCSKLTSLRIRCEVIPGLISDTPYDVVFDSAGDDNSLRSGGEFCLKLKEIILKGVKANVALELVRYNTDNLDKFHWQLYESDPKSANVQSLMRYLCQIKDTRELEIFASNLCEEDEDDLFHVSPEALEKLEKIRTYMFTMDPKAIHSLSSIIMSKVDKLRDLTVWCEDEIPEDRADLVLLFMGFVASCQRNLRKLCLGLPLCNTNVFDHVKSILSCCSKLDSFIFGIHRVQDMETMNSLRNKYKHFYPVEAWRHLSRDTVDQTVRGWYEVKCALSHKENLPSKKHSFRHSADDKEKKSKDKKSKKDAK